MSYRFQIRLFPLIAFAVLTAEYSRGVFCHVITAKEVEHLFKECRNAEAEREAKEIQLVKEGKVIDSDSKVADLCLIRQRSTDPVSRMRGLKQLPFEVVTNKLFRKYKLTRYQINEILPNIKLKGPYSKKALDACLPLIAFEGQCDANFIYRSADGTCNNVQNPRWGSAGSCFKRLLPPNYVGASGFRHSVVGGPLPEPRDLSLNIHSHLKRPTKLINNLHVIFGQILAHDITFAPVTVQVDNSVTDCCNVTGEFHPECIPISIRPDDPFYSQFGEQCANIVRSAVCPTCRLGPRQQVNQITAFVDASFVYGSSLNQTGILRTNDRTGRMRVQHTPVGDLLPPSSDPLNDQCSFVNTGNICFLAGDTRANQHTALTCLQTIFLLEHNRLADGLRQMNPLWNGERIFQEARRIVGAEMQAITYNEFLPITLGKERMTYFKLWISDRGWWSAYNSSLDPTLHSEFSTAVFRYGHSQINGVVTRTPRINRTQLRMLRDEFFEPFDLQKGLISPLIRGITKSPAQFHDRHMVPDVTNFLYRRRGQSTGLDLASLDIQRGRDHGVPTYTEMVLYCSEGKLEITQFRDLVSNHLMSQNNVILLQQNYRDVRDVDLWTGVLSELHNEGAIVGPIAACVIGIQFFNLKFGDRFYFEHGFQAGSFTYQQAQELRKIKMLNILCLNTDVKKLPLLAMMFSNKKNPLMPCRKVKGVDLSYWRE